MSKKADLYLAERNKGKTYQEIAEQYGVSYQTVAAAIGRRSPGHFRVYTKKNVIYPNLRNWLNDNKVCRNEMLRRMGLTQSGKSVDRLNCYFRGDAYPNKQNIDKMLAVTGMTYEELFAREEDT